MDYKELNAQLSALLKKGDDSIANLANASALLKENLPSVNWVGFYFFRGTDLVLGPFQGKLACMHIKRGHGVCGTAFGNNETVNVADVNAFPGHIACDAVSRSEIAIPLRSVLGVPVGIMDIDSPELNRFSSEDQKGLEEAAAIIEAVVLGTSK